MVSNTPTFNKRMWFQQSMWLSQVILPITCKRILRIRFLQVDKINCNGLRKFGCGKNSPILASPNNCQAVAIILKIHKFTFDYQSSKGKLKSWPKINPIIPKMIWKVKKTSWTHILIIQPIIININKKKNIYSVFWSETLFWWHKVKPQIRNIQEISAYSFIY